MITRHSSIFMIIGLADFEEKTAPDSLQNLEMEMAFYFDGVVDTVLDNGGTIETIWRRRISCFWDVADDTIFSAMEATVRSTIEIQRRWIRHSERIQDSAPFGCLEMGGCSRYSHSGFATVMSNFGQRIGFCRDVTENEEAVRQGPFLCGPRYKSYLQKHESMVDMCRFTPTDIVVAELPVYRIEFTAFDD